MSTSISTVDHGFVDKGSIGLLGSGVAGAGIFGLRYLITVIDLPLFLQLGGVSAGLAVGGGVVQYFVISAEKEEYIPILKGGWEKVKATAGKYFNPVVNSEDKDLG